MTGQVLSFIFLMSCHESIFCTISFVSIWYNELCPAMFLSRDTVMSRAKFTRSARRTVYLYAKSKVETSRDYQISITAEPIELIISLTDSAYPNYFIKICSFLLYVLYEKSYYNVKCKNQKIYLMYVRMSSFKF